MTIHRYDNDCIPLARPRYLPHREVPSRRLHESPTFVESTFYRSNDKWDITLCCVDPFAILLWRMQN